MHGAAGQGKGTDWPAECGRQLPAQVAPKQWKLLPRELGCLGALAVEELTEVMGWDWDWGGRKCE